MPKINTATLPRPAAIIETRIFTDDRVPGAELTVTLKASAEFGDMLDVTDLGERLVHNYAQNTSPPVSLGKKKIKITPALCMAIATIMTMQQGGPDECYEAEDWFRISVAMPAAMSQIYLWASDLLKRTSTVEKDDDGKPQVPNG